MRRLATIALLACLWPCSSPAAEATEDPLSTELRERVEVGLVLLDAVVLDRRGQPIEGLTIEDFQVVVAGSAVPVDTLDFRCFTADTGASITLDERPERRKVVFALDYSHMNTGQRGQVIDFVKQMVRDESAASMDLMVAALTGEVRVEQRLTSDTGAVLASLERMQRDPALWKPSFFHQNERGFIESLTALFDLLGQEDGTKIVLFFSAIGDVPLEEQFARVAAAAAASRSVIYGVDVRGLLTDSVREIDAFSRTDSMDEIAVLWSNLPDSADVAPPKDAAPNPPSDTGPTGPRWEYG